MHPDPQYGGSTLDPATVADDPVVQFRRWFADAEAAIPVANAMALATVGIDGRPSARMVLLKDVDDRGFVFFTNYDSRKGVELAAQPVAALLFYWHALHRQVRIEGRVERVTAAESDAYFATRPRHPDPPGRGARRAARRGGAAPARALERLPGPARSDRAVAGPGQPAAR